MNPEFQRNLILEFSFAKIIGMPLFLTFIFALTYLMNDNHLGEEAATVALGLYVFIVLFWGAKQTAESIYDELRNHTWDIQKTSAISPWSLTWGKLFGSTLFNWYGGILCLVVYSFSTAKKDSIFGMIGYAVGCGLLVQCFSLLISLFSFRTKNLASASMSYLFILFLLPFPWVMMASENNNALQIIHWYSFAINNHIFGLISLALACVWSVIGIYRLLAQELQIRTLPWVWLLFISFLVLYSHGLIVGNSDKENFPNSHAMMLTVFVVCVSLTYSLILIEDNNPMLMRRLWLYVQEENWQRVLEEIPCWFVSLLLVLPACIYGTFYFPAEVVKDLHAYPLPIFLLMLRDIAIVLFFSYAPNPKRALGLSILYLTFLYWIIPAIFIKAGSPIIAALFLPMVTDNLALGIVFAGGQVALIGYLLFNRWQKTVNQSQNYA